MAKVSVIVPVYNTEKYLRRCVDSILSQTFTDFELILVNDGSKDNSGKICDEYAQKDSRVIVVNKENGGVSSARNKGIDVAQGDWIAFVDSDDYVSERYLSDFPMDISHDMEMSGIEAFGNENWISQPDQEKLNSCLADLCNCIFECRYITSPCAKLVKRDILNRNDIRFDVNIKIAEDAMFIMCYLKYCSNVYQIACSNYFYRHPDDITNKYRQDVEHLKYNLEKLNNIECELSRKFGFNPRKNLRQINMVQYACFMAYMKSLSDEKKIVSEWRKYRKLNLYKYKFTMSLKERAYLILSFLFPNWFYLRMRRCENA